MKRISIFVAVCVTLSLLTSCVGLKSTNVELESYYIPTIVETTLSFEIKDNKRIQFSNFGFQIPENFELKSNNGNILVENKDLSVQVTVEDKTVEITDWDKYIQETVTSIEKMGFLTGKIETIKIRDYCARRFVVTSSSIKMFCYFIDLNGSKVVLNVVSKGTALKDIFEVDRFVSNIEFF